MVLQFSSHAIWDCFWTYQFYSEKFPTSASSSTTLVSHWFSHSPPQVQMSMHSSPAMTDWHFLSTTTFVCTVQMRYVPNLCWCWFVLVHCWAEFIFDIHMQTMTNWIHVHRFCDVTLIPHCKLALGRNTCCSKASSVGGSALQKLKSFQDVTTFLDTARRFVLLMHGKNSKTLSSLSELRFLLATTTGKPATAQPLTEDAFEQHVWRP